MSKRTDIHRPSVIQPEDYDFVAIVSHKDEDGSMNLIERKILRDHMARTGDKFSQHAHGGSCHVCGAGAMTLAYFHHVPSGEYIVTGEDCCEKISEGHADRFRAIRDEANAMANAKAGKLKAQGLLKDWGLEKSWEIYSSFSDLFAAENSSWEEGVTFDIVQKLIRYGDISEKQQAFLGKLAQKIAQKGEQQAKWDAENEKAAPVPVVEGRMTVEGTVLTTKIQESQYGDTLKMLVQHADGWKVWGSVPSALDSWDYEADEHSLKKGVKVKFDAKVVVSDDDSKFGFFSRPTKAVLIEEDA